MKKIIIGVSCLIFICCSIFLGIFYVQTSAVSRNTDVVEFEIKKGDTYLTITNILKEDNLIKSTLFYKIYIKMFNPTQIQVGKYELSESMSVSQIISVFSKGSNYNPDTVIFTIPEGKRMDEVASIISDKTSYTKGDLLSVWNSSSFIDEVITKYWFVKEDVKKSGIRYSLEGYFFPDTYQIVNKEADIKSIAYKMLDKMDEVLSNYKDKIEASSYSVHQILTMASIIEYEAILDDDRPIIASVFYNRLDSGMKLQSCATVGYAIDEWKLTYSSADLDTDSPYNTYYYKGLPIGPGNMPGLKSIEAAINPSKTDYMYFLANVCDHNNKKTYFSKTYEEHVEKKNLYLTCLNK